MKEARIYCAPPEAPTAEFFPPSEVRPPTAVHVPSSDSTSPKDASAPDRAAGRRPGAAVLVFLGSIVLALLLAEAVLRWAYDEVEVNGNYWGRGAFVADPAAGYRHAPGFRGRAVRPGVFDVEVALDDLGLRQADRERQLAYPRTLLVLGDSFPFGLGVEADESFPTLLAAELNPLGIGVVNGGQTGYDVAQSAAWGRTLIDRLGPDAVLLTVFLANDVSGAWFADRERVDVVDGYRLSRSRWGPGTALDRLRTRSYLWKFAGGRLATPIEGRRRRGELREANRRAPEAVLATTVEPLRALAAYCRERRIPFNVAMIPPRKGSTRYDEPFRQALASAGIRLIDLTGSFTRAEHYFPGDGHWNAVGHAAAARRLVHAIAVQAEPATPRVAPATASGVR